jgi:hypothetical protein
MFLQSNAQTNTKAEGYGDEGKGGEQEDARLGRALFDDFLLHDRRWGRGKEGEREREKERERAQEREGWDPVSLETQWARKGGGEGAKASGGDDRILVVMIDYEEKMDGFTSWIMSGDALIT